MGRSTWYLPLDLLKTEPELSENEEYRSPMERAERHRSIAAAAPTTVVLSASEELEEPTVPMPPSSTIRSLTPDASN
jgi:hypothetical protein